MTHNVLALIDRPSGRDHCAETAARLAGELSAGLILAVDPHDEPFKAFEPELNHLISLAAKRRIPTSTMLVDVGDAASVVRAARCNHVDVVVVEQPEASDTEAARVASALHEADIAVVSTGAKKP